MTIKLDHINLTVANFADSVNWYKKIFGFELVESGVAPNGIKWGIVAQNKLKLFYGSPVDYPSSKSWYVHDPSGHEIEVSYAELGKLQFHARGAL